MKDEMTTVLIDNGMSVSKMVLCRAGEHPKGVPQVHDVIFNASLDKTTREMALVDFGAAKLPNE